MGRHDQHIYDSYQYVPGYTPGQGPMHYGMGAASAAPTPAPEQAWSPGQVPYPGYMPGYATQMPPEQPKKKRKRWLWVLIVLLVLALIAGLACYFLLDCSGTSKRSGVAGQLEGKSEAEIQAEIDRVVDEGMFNISIASSVQMATPTSPAELRIENVPGNRYLMRVVIVEETTGEQLYETDLIEPNFHIQNDTLDVALDPGVHSCLAIFYAYDPETEEEIGQAAARITIQVGG